MASIGLIVLILIVAGLSWTMHNERILINNIQIEGAEEVDVDLIMELVEENFSGSYLWIFTKKNILIFPKHQLESEILDKHKQIKNIAMQTED